MEDPEINIVLIMEPRMINESMTNNYKSARFGIQRS